MDGVWKSKYRQSQEDDTNHRLLNYQKFKCPVCGTLSRKEGKRKNTRGDVQKFYCGKCKKYYCDSKLPHKIYNPKAILNAITLYNIGYTIEETNKKINSQYKEKVPRSTLYYWLKTYEKVCTFINYRRKFNITPDVIKSKKLYHSQIYEFKLHHLKINILCKRFPELRTYLWDMMQNCPEEVFLNGPRCSQFYVNIQPQKTTRENNAQELAKLALLLTDKNNQRHDAVENFMLHNDTATVAVEVPVYLLPNEVPELRLEEPLSGHIDLLQVRWNKIHILDFKPDKYEGNSLQQVFLYALALSKRTGIPLSSMKCACFNDSDYYEIEPEGISLKPDRETIHQHYKLWKAKAFDENFYKEIPLNIQEEIEFRYLEK